MQKIKTKCPVHKKLFIEQFRKNKQIMYGELRPNTSNTWV